MRQCRREDCNQLSPRDASECPYCGTSLDVPSAGVQLVFEWGEVPLGAGQRLLIGRKDSPVASHLERLGYEKVSRRHAEIDCSVDSIVTVKDLNSMNGTFINGEKIAAEVPVPVSAGDEVRFSSTLLMRITEGEN